MSADEFLTSISKLAQKGLDEKNLCAVQPEALLMLVGVARAAIDYKDAVNQNRVAVIGRALTRLNGSFDRMGGVPQPGPTEAPVTFHAAPPEPKPDPAPAPAPEPAQATQAPAQAQTQASPPATPAEPAKPATGGDSLDASTTG